QGGHFETALQSASAGGHVLMVQFLLKEGFEDKPGGDYGTVLCAACANGKIEVVKALLQAGARQNGDGEQTSPQEQCRC
ncbi:hypothetical protein B0H14DRAFT_2387636, partial [Mycena olivaceomarginata]